ncbi:hypothetical protein QOZ80_3BG0279770 [Eleusine coracana subsp. coracana]|nr:hypothetical protein QOZ80_3BG0279770 [Eleusine coracana subsp. coracana]
MAASEELILLSQDDEKIASLVVIPMAMRSSFVPTATFRLVLVHSTVAEAMKKAVSCHVPVGEVRDRDDAADDVFRFLLAKIDDPVLRLEVARDAEKAVTHVRVRCAAAAAAAEEEPDEDDEEEKLLDVEFRLLVVLDSESVDQPEEAEEEEEVGSDLESDDECWQRGASDGEHWQNMHDDDHQIGDTSAGDQQFAARQYDHQAATATWIRGRYEVSSDGPEFFDQHELTARDLSRLLRIMFKGGDVESDEAYKRTFHGNARVSRVAMAAISDKAFASTNEKRPPRPITRMRTGF